MKKVTYKVVSPTNFINFLNRFSGIEPALLIEIEDGEMKAKTYTPDKAVVKFSSMGMNESFDLISDDEPNYMFGLVSIEKFVSSLKNFKDDVFDMTVEYNDLEGKNVGSRIIVHNKRLRLTFDCASYRLFTHITDDLFKNNIAEQGSDEFITSFDLEKVAFNEISSVSKIDSDYKLVSLIAVDNQVRAKGKMFDLQVVEDDGTKINDTSITFYKHHFALVEKEDSLVEIKDDKLVFSSKESDTITVVGSSEEE